jgi:hypothetical protein
MVLPAQLAQQAPMEQMEPMVLLAPREIKGSKVKLGHRVQQVLLVLLAQLV